MIRGGAAVLSVLVGAAWIPACKAGDPVKRPSGDEDAGPIDVLPPPELEAIPERTPLDTVAARGSTEGSRVVAQGPVSGALVTVVLPGGTFCQDTPINSDGSPTTLNYYAMGGDGRISEPITVEVVHDPAAAQPPSPTCGGDMPVECADQEVCGADGDDEDCNGLADDCDPACNGCTDDPFEPNDIPFNVPNPPSGTNQMALCPCRDDWFAFQARAQDRIHATIDFTHTDIDIDMKLFRSGPEGQGTDGVPVDTAASTENQEEIDFTADEPGTYFLQIYPFKNDNATGSYTLTID